MDVAGIDADRAAMSGHFLHVDNGQAVSSQDLGRRMQRKIREMLMIDRIELASFDQAQQMWEF